VLQLDNPLCPRYEKRDEAASLVEIGATPSTEVWAGILIESPRRDGVTGLPVRMVVTIQKYGAIVSGDDVLQAVLLLLDSVTRGVQVIPPSVVAVEGVVVNNKRRGTSCRVQGTLERRDLALGPQKKPEKLVQDPECTELVSNFCQYFPALRIAPNRQELEELWMECDAFPTAVIDHAMCEQLSWAPGDHMWQPKLRVLYALEHFYWKEGKGRAITNAVFEQAKELMQYLLEVQQCREKASQVIHVLQGQAGAAEAAVAKEPGPVAATFCV